MHLKSIASLACVTFCLSSAAVAQPWTLNGSTVSLQFDANATSGVVLTSVTNPVTGAVVINDTALAPDLWEIALYDVTDPANARVVNSSTTHSTFSAAAYSDKVLLCWYGIEVAGTTDELNVVVTVRAPDPGDVLDFASRWTIHAYYSHAYNAQTRLFRVNFPMVAIDPMSV